MPRTTTPSLAVLAALFGAAPLQAQLDTTVDHCYRFDRNYFSWVGGPATGRQVLVDSTAVMKLAAARHPLGPFRDPPGARVVTPLTMAIDSLSASRWLRVSRWRNLPPDNLEVVWRNGLYGPVFRMRVVGDSLQGLVRFTTDVVGGEPPPQRATPTRASCP